MSTAREYFAGHAKVLRSDLIRVGVRFPDREVAKLEAEGAFIIVPLQDGSGWVVAPKVEPPEEDPETRRGLVLDRLLRAQGDWVYGPELANPSVGGSEGLRRLRELRAQGHPIEARKREGRQGWEYRLGEEGDGVVSAPIPEEATLSVAPEPSPTRFWYCSRVGCGMLGSPDVYTSIDEKARYTTGKCPKHKKVVLVADTRLPF